MDRHGSSSEDDDAGSAPTEAAAEPFLPGAAGERFQLCSGETFATQRSAAECSGVLIAEDLVLTAGHCLNDAAGCDAFVYVIGYAQAPAEGAQHVPRILRCNEVIIREVGQLADGSNVDYAIIRLEDAPSIEGAFASASTSVLADAIVTSVGFPLGLPLKIDQRGKVLSSGPSHQKRDHFDHIDDGRKMI